MNMTNPERATRLWLTVAILWLVRVAGEADAAIPDASRLDLTSVQVIAHVRLQHSGGAWIAGRSDRVVRCTRSAAAAE